MLDGVCLICHAGCVFFCSFYCDDECAGCFSSSRQDDPSLEVWNEHMPWERERSGGRNLVGAACLSLGCSCMRD